MNLRLPYGFSGAFLALFLRETGWSRGETMKSEGQAELLLGAAALSGAGAGAAAGSETIGCGYGAQGRRISETQPNATPASGP